MKQKVILAIAAIILTSASVRSQDCATIQRPDVMQVWGVRSGADLCTFNSSSQTGDKSKTFGLKVTDTLYYALDEN